MSIFKNLFSRKFKSTYPGKGDESASLPPANEAANKAIEKLIANDSSETRRALYVALMSSSLYVPLDKETSDDDSNLSLPGVQLETGELALYAFTGGDALELFDPVPKSLIIFSPEKFFQIALENNAAEIHLNPEGPVGGVLARSEFLYLAEGAIPDAVGNMEYPQGMEMRMGVPEASEAGSIIGCLRQAAEDTKHVHELYLASIMVNEGHPRLMAGVRLVADLSQEEIEAAQDELSARLSSALEDPLDVTTIHDLDVQDMFRENSLLVFRR